ncbi:MAG: hypothetical protein ACI9MB_000040, partial [Verrucomicrobiales bacterium]
SQGKEQREGAAGENKVRSGFHILHNYSLKKRMQALEGHLCKRL